MTTPAPLAAGLRLPALLALASLALASLAPAQSVWPSQYKIRPWETSRLTEADVVGLDGIVYPNFTGAGVTGGIPDINNASIRAGYTIYNVVSYGANGNDTALDDTAVANALAAANANAAAGGRSILYFPAGTYYLAQPTTITSSRVVVDGDGPAATRIRLQTGFTRPSSTTALTPVAAFNFHASALWNGGNMTASATILRGSRTVTFSVDPAPNVSVGQWVRVIATSAAPGTTMRTRYSKPGMFVNYGDALGHFGRLHFAKVTAVNSANRTVTLDRSFPHDVYADELPQLRRGPMLEQCGIQDLSIETMSASVQLDSVRFVQVAESWMKNVTVSNPRNWPYNMDSMTRSEIRDCQFYGSWADINNGSTAYLGFTGNTDCLMINCSAGDLRHMAIFQMANRSVISGCTFTGDSIQSPQLHGRFPLENLIENTTFNTARTTATAFAVDPAHTLRHGPNGPRNVFYNNRVLTGAGAFALLGGQENLILVYNRILKNGDLNGLPAVWAIDRTFDTILRGNVFQANTTTPFINFEDTTNPGWEVTDNHIYGTNRHLWSGDSSPALAHNNRFYPAGASPISPTVPTPSLYAWQKANANSARLVVWIERRSVNDNGATIPARVVRVKSSTSSPLTVNLSANIAGLSFPSTVTIPAGSVFADFTITGVNVTNHQTVLLQASASGHLSDGERVVVYDQGVAQPDLGLGRMNASTAGLPANWRRMNLGRVSAAGSASFSGGTWTITGAGLETATSHSTLARGGRKFVYQTINGNGEIRARITSAVGDRQAGLMIADDESVVTEFIWVTPDGRVLSSGHGTVSHANPEQYAAGGTKIAPSWLRLRRVGSVFTAFRSTVANPTSESDWTVLATIDFYKDNTTSGETDYKSQSTLDSRMHFGMVVNSGSETTTATATFTGVSVTGTVVAP
jgi:hypothetical protein